MAGEIALSGLQWGVETTAGDGAAATSVVPILQGNMIEHVDSDFPEENRNSFIKHYRNFATKNYIELSFQFKPTFETLPQIFRHFLKGVAAAGTTYDTSGFTFGPYTPTATSDDLKTFCFEVFDGTQNWQVPYVIANKMELTYTRNAGLALSCDYLGQKAVKQAKTGSLSVAAAEDIVAANTVWYRDTTTIGTTQATDVLDAKFTLDNGWVQEFVMNGNLFPVGAHRGSGRSMALEMTQQFLTTTEYDKFRHTGPGNIRKIRALTTGSLLTAANRDLTIDWYGSWQTANFDNQDGQRVLKLAGMSYYGGAGDWSATIHTGLSPMV